VVQLRTSDGFTERVAIAGEPVPFKDITTESRMARHIIRQAGYRFLAIIPLKSTGRVIGGMSLASRHSRQLRPDKMQLLLTTGEILAMVIENARLHGRLALSEAKYRTIFENALIGIYRSTRDGKLLEANATFARILGYGNINELLKTSALDLFLSPEDRLRWQSDLEARGVLQSEIQLRRRDGTIVWANDLARVERDREGKVLYYEGTLTDVTDRKRAEEARLRLEGQLVHSQKLQTIGMLAGGIAHDFNNILTTIKGYISLLKMQISEDHDFYNAFTDIEEAASSAADLTQKLLGFVRARRYQVEPVNLNQIIEHTVSLLRASIDKRIALETDLQEEIWPVEADAGQMQQVLLNICLNARDAMPAGGRLTIESKNIAGDKQAFPPTPVPAGGPRVLISILDTGTGMTRDVQEHIFEPFFTTKEKGKGTGLGLAMVYGIVRNHGGRVEFSSATGSGTTFRIYLPATSGNSTVERLPEETKASNGNELILVVDDEPAMRSIIQNILQTRGYNVLLADNGEAAIEAYRLRKDEISLAILDMIMPGIGGHETFLRMKTINPEVRVILSSGYFGEEQAQEIMSQGARAFIQKPYAARELTRLVRKVLDK
jgi:PAS domain S-box-containing protein